MASSLEERLPMPERITHTAHDDAPLSSARSAQASAINRGHLEAREGDVWVGRSVTINRPRQELYEF
jgi:hypothetical protein